MKLQWVQFRLKADPSPGALDLGHLLNRGNNQRKEEATSTLLLSWQRLTKPSMFTPETSRTFRSASGDFLSDPVGGLGTPQPHSGERESEPEAGMPSACSSTKMCCWHSQRQANDVVCVVFISILTSPTI